MYAKKLPLCRSLPHLLTICGESIVTKCCERTLSDRDSGAATRQSSRAFARDGLSRARLLVVAVKPSERMIQQRTLSAPVVRAITESLPFHVVAHAV
jgi:hypothetical protein